MDVMEDIMTLAIQVENQIACSNKDNTIMDEANLEDTIDRVGIEGNLPAKQIDRIKVKKGIQKKKHNVTITTSMQTRRSNKNNLK